MPDWLAQESAQWDHIEGQIARKEGLTLESNPHPIGTRAHNLWRRGWELQDRTIKARK